MFIDFLNCLPKHLDDFTSFAQNGKANAASLLDDIVNGIFAICEESGWQLPPHNSYVRDAQQLILPDCESPVLDLFACETGAQLAMIRYLLREELDSVSPFLCKRILYEIRTRIVDPYLHEHFWWMGSLPCLRPRSHRKSSG